MPNKVDHSSNALDRSALAMLEELQEDGELDIIVEVGGLFIKYGPEKIEAIKRAVAEKDAKGLELAAHSLKSSSSYVGGMRLSALSGELEKIGRSGNLRRSGEIALQVEVEYERVIAALKAEIGERS